MPATGRISEARFREVVASMIKRGAYPDNNSLRSALGLVSSNPRSGLTPKQSRWRAEEVEAAGYNWSASSRSRRLTRS